MVKAIDFGFPHYDGEALEIASVSDSSDCNHVGNGIQCCFYNHDGCGRGTTCTFSHAPVEKSVRDGLYVHLLFSHTILTELVIAQWEECLHLFLARSMQIQMYLLSQEGSPSERWLVDQRGADCESQVCPRGDGKEDARVTAVGD